MSDQAEKNQQSNWKDRLFGTADSSALLIIRLGLGVVMFGHGLQETFGLFGGYGFAAMVGGFEHMGIPAPFAVLAIMAPLLGGLGLILGLLSRIAAFGLICMLTVAVIKVHLSVGFFMNWSGQQQGEGYEYHVLAIAIALAVLIAGAGRWSIDRAIACRD